MKYFLLIFTTSLLITSHVAQAAVFVVTESEGDRFGYELEKVELFFSVDNTYEDILEFAIGNNGAYQAGYRDDLALSPTTNLANGFLAYKDGGSWWVNDNDSAPRALEWMNQASNFDGFTIAFLYTSLCEGCSGGPLEIGITDGYAGEADESQSPFAAYSEANGVANPIIGSTTVVPLPAAAWLFISALGGLVVVARRLAEPGS